MYGDGAGAAVSVAAYIVARSLDVESGLSEGEGSGGTEDENGGEVSGVTGGLVAGGLVAGGLVAGGLLLLRGGISAD